MEKKIILPVLCSLILILGVPQAFAQSSTTPPDIFTAAISPPKTCVGGETDLLIQDITDFWQAGTSDPRGSYVSELISQGKNWCSIDSSAIGATDLSGFKVIILTANQNAGFYTNVFPGGIVHPDLDTWVFNGGIMSASLGTNSHDDNRVFIGGLKAIDDSSNDLSIVTPAHPLISNGLLCPGGNCAVIVDAGSKTDIDSWSASSHESFISLPAGTIVILNDDDGNPVAIEYPYGAGTVVANGLTDSWMYSGQAGVTTPNKKFLSNDISYQNSIVLDVPVGGTDISINTSALLLAGVQSVSMWMIPVVLAGIGIGVFVIKRRN